MFGPFFLLLHRLCNGAIQRTVILPFKSREGGEKKGKFLSPLLHTTFRQVTIERQNLYFWRSFVSIGGIAQW